ncbi:2-C-methyl-D-erythritol 4-phosphate cytidylyltransferase [Basilea psittacipulmonis]|uniref:2-C-methyl-D-erythritol 4-phosphate cytidylyltransferase n=1 Tax=Basilea psittacipulmonis DSM 24701 TaxID=1072685 RepID=A0A077DI46_9BURK|nr:2-C-methyl-D-erythritol 4-phosphate cytidylyltransferase [Basilea psittacipulmonis]AIL33187.1 hypothetical protein IX83_07675 [Basilea psittacipulmonis DSM 24701]
MEIHAILPAAGVGSRLGASLPKQYLMIDGKPLIWYSIQALLADKRITFVHIGLSPQDKEFERLVDIQDARVKWYYCGGQTRAETVLNTIKTSGAKDWVLVHDAARPGLTMNGLARLIDMCLSQQKGGILAMPVSDTVKYGIEDENGCLHIDHTQSRSSLYLAQTPQMFPVSELLNALETVDLSSVTDEASAVELKGGHPLLVRGDWQNLKVTWPADLEIVSKFLSATET